MEFSQIVSVAITTALGILIYLLKEKFKSIDQSFDRLEKRVDKMEGTLEGLTKEVYKISGYIFSQEKNDDCLPDCTREYK